MFCIANLARRYSSTSTATQAKRRVFSEERASQSVGTELAQELQVRLSRRPPELRLFPTSAYATYLIGGSDGLPKSPEKRQRSQEPQSGDRSERTAERPTGQRAVAPFLVHPRNENRRYNIRFTPRAAVRCGRHLPEPRARPTIPGGHRVVHEYQRLACLAGRASRRPSRCTRATSLTWSATCSTLSWRPLPSCATPSRERSRC